MSAMDARGLVTGNSARNLLMESKAASISWVEKLTNCELSDQASEVEVRFYAESPKRTRVELEHRHTDRHGPESSFVVDGVDGDEGWPLYLARYAALFSDKG